MVACLLYHYILLQAPTHFSLTMAHIRSKHVGNYNTYTLIIVLTH